MWYDFPDDDQELPCQKCGADMWISSTGISHHWGPGAEYIDHDADADHVAIPPEEPEPDPDTLPGGHDYRRE